MNKSIKNSQILGNPALELQDQRNDLIDQLASYLPITVKYRDEEVGPGQFVEVLDVHFTASDGSKYTLISDSDFGHLDTGITDGLASLSITDAAGNSFAGMEDLLGNGTLKGMFDILNKSGEFDKPASTIKGLDITRLPELL
ncbi:MAG: FlgK family flagellar hook-associated protein [[Clostridium] nexile]